MKLIDQHQQNKAFSATALKLNVLDNPPTLPDRYLRIWHIIGDPKANPPIPAIIPVSRSTWLSWVKSGKAPAAVVKQLLIFSTNQR